MNNINQQYPNPVLASGRDDYNENCSFKFHLNADEIKVNDTNIVLPVSYQLVCDGLERLVSEGRAAVIVIVYSVSAHFRRLYKFPSDSSSMEIVIGKYDVVDMMEIDCLISATSSIKDFRCPGEFNELYFGGQSFDIRKGDALALTQTRKIALDDSELEKPISSIFEVHVESDITDSVEPSFSDQKIVINVSEQIFNIYREYKDKDLGSMRRYVNAIVVYPVLVEAISLISEAYRSSDDTYSDLRWFRTIERKSEEKGIHLNSDNELISYTTVANKLLRNIATDALVQLQSLIQDMNDGSSQDLGGLD